MIPNPNQLTAELRSMTDAQLQQYAQMHKNDPYILPMALSESNARKMMRMQAQAQQFQPQPTERDKALMSMQESLPEEVGIGALPAQNLEGMADGGIVGYADGGGMMMGDGYNMAVGYEPNRTPAMSYAGGGAVESYAPGGSTDKNGVERYAEEGYTGRSQFVRDIARIPEMYTNWWEQQRAEDEAKAAIEKERAEKRKAREEASRKASFFNYMFGTPEKEAEGKAELAAIQTAAPATTASAAEKERRRMDESRRTARESEQVSAAANQAAAASAGQRPPATGGGAPTRPAAAAPAGIAALTPMQRAEQYLPSQDQAMREYETRETKAADEQLARLRAAMTEDKSKAYEGLESRIKAQESAAAGKLSEEKAMAIFQAGLAIMGGTSPHAAANIGAGALKGLEGYKDAKKELDKAAREREKMLADIEQARRAESRDDRKMMMTFMERADDRKEKIRDSVFAAGQSLGIKKGEMAAGFEKLEIQQAGEDRRARMQAAAMNRTPAEIQLIERVAAEKKIPFSQAMEVVAGLKREPMTREKAMQAWMQPGAAAMIQAQYPNIKTFDDYWNAMSGGAGAAGTGGAGEFKVIGSRPAP